MGLAVGDAEVGIHYVGAPRYKVTVTAEDYKTAEQELKAVVQKITTAVEKASGTASFKRKEEK